jgi:ABC-type bacteriocin/lantibiotic exporter with double-glycine peptidase domain
MSANRAAWLYYLACYRGSKLRLAATLAASLALSLLSLPLILLVRYIFDTVLPRGDFRALLLCSLAMLAASVANSAVAFWIRRSSLNITKKVILDLRAKLIARLFEFPAEYFGRHERMALHSAIVQDTERVDVMSNALVAEVLPAVMVGITVAVVLLYVNWLLLLASLAIAPLLFFANRVLQRRLQEQVNRFRHSFEAFSKGVLFVLQAMDLTRMLGAEEFEMDRQTRTLRELRDTSTRVAWFDTLYNLTQSGLATLAGLIILVVGGAGVAAHTLTVGALVSFYVTARILNSQAGTVLGGAPKIVLGIESLGSVHRLLTAPEHLPYRGGRKISPTGRVALENVSFAYRDDRWVLRNVSLEIEPGSTVALIGPNGSGKTSLVALLCGFYRPRSGRVLADGCPYDDLDVRHLRRSFGLVPQEPLLFAGSVRDNISYGRPDATLAQIQEAAARATADSFIAELEHGYDTPVGEDGVLLSGGQRQRIAIARALLGDPRVLILDEPANHLDADSVTTLIANLRALPQRPALLIVTHDERMLAHADCVCQLGKGIAELQPQLAAAKEDLWRA